MIDFHSALQAYTGLSYEQKKIRLMTLCEIFQSHSVVIQNILPLIQADKISEAEMMETYGNLLEAMQKVNKKDLQKTLDKLSTIQQKLADIRKEENKTKENADDVLQQL